MSRHPSLTPLPAGLDPDILLDRAALWPRHWRDGAGDIIACLPRVVLVRSGNGELHGYYRQPDFSYHCTPCHMPLPAALKNELALTPPVLPGPGFYGGMAGWLGYEYAAPRTGRKQAPDAPDAVFGFYDCFIRRTPADGALLYCAQAATASYIYRLLQEAGAAEPFRLLQRFQPLMSATDYRQAFDQVQRFLQAGDCYQVNLAQGFRAACSGNSHAAYRRLLDNNHPPHAVYSASPLGDILCLSPELFLRFDGGRVVTRPIKGTRPRGRTPQEDEQQRRDLQDHPKDRAENLMIVDLLRNDLGKHAATGSVRVDTLFRLESFTHVHHLVSQISCRLRADSHPLDLLFDAFPGGSITGAPKKRAMEIIDALENCERSVYCGTIGWMAANGDGEWNIAIRTLLRVGPVIYGWAGGGIVADSVCESEYQECFNKIGPLLHTLEHGFLCPDD